jgi:hypothetical protein
MEEKPGGVKDPSLSFSLFCLEGQKPAPAGLSIPPSILPAFLHCGTFGRGWRDLSMGEKASLSHDQMTALLFFSTSECIQAQYEYE